MLESSYLIVSLLFSSIGLGYFIYGKKQHRKIVFYAGIALMIYPYFVTAVPAMVLIGMLLMMAPRLIKL